MHHMLFTLLFSIIVFNSQQDLTKELDCEVAEGSISGSPLFSSGTIFLWPLLITSDDKTVYTGNVETGKRTVTMYSRLQEAWISVPAWTFDASFEDQATVECCVNADEYSQTYAQTLCDTYLPTVGQVPNEVRNHGGHLEMWVMAGDASAGGGYWTPDGVNPHFLLHEEYARRQIDKGVFEELLLHELTHSSFPTPPSGYICSVNEDQVCLSHYAREHIIREDLAESISAWIGVTYKRDRLTEEDKVKIEWGIPHRLGFINSQEWNMYPLTGQSTGSGYVFSSTGNSANTLDLPLTYERTGETHGGYPVFRAKEKESALFVDDNGYWGTARQVGQFSTTAYNSAWPAGHLPPVYGWLFAHNGWEEDHTLHLTPYGKIST